MKKSERMETFIKGLATEGDKRFDPCYLGYFDCFNRQLYYEAHDVLEHLWLHKRDENHAYYKGLIQIAGAYVHLKKQYFRPHHHKDGRRLRPAVRLFDLGRQNIAPYGPWHLGLDIQAVCDLCEKTARQIEQGKFERNPWRPEVAPMLQLEVTS